MPPLDQVHSARSRLEQVQTALSAGIPAPSDAKPPAMLRGARASHSTKFQGYAVNVPVSAGACVPALLLNPRREPGQHGSIPAVRISHAPLEGSPVDGKSGHRPAAPTVIDLPDSARNEAASATSYLGTLDAPLTRILEEVIEHFPATYSAAGELPLAGGHCTSQQVSDFIRTGRAPRGAPNSIDFLKAVFTRFAVHLGHPDQEGLQRFLVELSAVRTPQEFEHLIPYYFAPSAGEVMRFVPPPFAPAPGVDLTRGIHYADFLTASGMPADAFERLAGNLSPRAPFFAGVFSDPAHKRWGVDFFTQVGAQLKTCSGGEAAAVVLFHPDCYGIRYDASKSPIKGSGITHISVMAISPQGDVCLNHQESISIAKGGAVRNLMTGSLGLVSESYDTRPLFQRVSDAFNCPSPAELPVDFSFNLHGGPNGMVTKVADFAAFQTFTRQLADTSRGNDGLVMLYAADPDHRLTDHAQLLRTNPAMDPALGERFARQPLMQPPGGVSPDRVTDYSNNCTLTTLLVLQHAGCQALPAGVKVSASMRLHEMQAILLQSGLLPDTDPNLPKMALACAKGPDDLTSKSFMMMGSRQSMEPGKGYPPDIPSEASHAFHGQAKTQPNPQARL
jgi:hypothetical protein